MLVLILLTDTDPHLLQEESKTCPRDSMMVPTTWRLPSELIGAAGLVPPSRVVARTAADYLWATLQLTYLHRRLLVFLLERCSKLLTLGTAQASMHSLHRHFHLTTSFLPLCTYTPNHIFICQVFVFHFISINYVLNGRKVKP